jgi:hypothetical protein
MISLTEVSPWRHLPSDEAEPNDLNFRKVNVNY